MFAIGRQPYCFWWMSSIISNFPTEMQFSRTRSRSPRDWHASRSVRATLIFPVVYVNDNFGQWKSDAGKLLAHCLRTDCAGKPFVEAIQPDEQDYCVLKPMHSAFFQTPLELLLRHLGTSSIILAGIATNSCILCTAHDARMRDFKVTVFFPPTLEFEPLGPLGEPLQQRAGRSSRAGGRGRRAGRENPPRDCPDDRRPRSLRRRTTSFEKRYS